jgi:hypothetical protein
MDCGPLRVVLANQNGVSASGGPDTPVQVGGLNAWPSGWKMQLGRFQLCQLVLNANNTAGTTPTLDVYVQKAVLQKDGSKVWTDVGHFNQVTTGTSQQVVEVEATDRSAATSTARNVQNKAIAAGTFNNSPWGDDWQVVWTIGGTGGPTYNFDVTATFWPLP